MRRYEKPLFRRAYGIDFVLVVIERAGPHNHGCRQCASCHGCR